MLGTITLLLILGVAAGLALLVLHEPGFYTRAEVPPGQERRQLSEVCFGQLAALVNQIKYGTEPWQVEISEAQLNSYFEEGFLMWGESEALRKRGVTEPRIVFEPDKMRVAFRYGSKPWSTIISLDVKVWLAPKDVNVVAVEFLGRHAGFLPISAQSILDLLSEQAQGRNIEVSWHRHNNNPVALVRFQADQVRPTFQLRRVDLSEGKIVIEGVPVQDVPAND